MLRSVLVRGWLRNATGGADPAPGPGGGAPPAPAPAPAPAGGAQPFAVFHNQAAFDERVQREARSILRNQVGVEDPAEIQRQLARARDLEAAETTRQREAMSAQERLTADLAAANARTTAAEAAAAAATDRANVVALCATRGIRNVNYALFEVGQARGTAGSAFDAAGCLDGLLARPEMRAALGIPSDPVVPAPVTTSPEPGAPPPAPPRNPGAPAPVDAMTMSGPQFAAHLASLGASA